MRARKLSESITMLEGAINAANSGASSKQTTNETAEQTVTRLNKALSETVSQLSKISFDSTKNLHKPKAVTIDLDRTTNEVIVDDRTKDTSEMQDTVSRDEKFYKLESNTKTFSGLPGKKLNHGNIFKRMNFY